MWCHLNRSAQFSFHLAKRVCKGSFEQEVYAFRAPVTLANLKNKMDEELQTIKVNVKGKDGQLLELKATVQLDYLQDSFPDGSNVGTVIAFHGVPGSHNDFKILKSHLQEKGVRLVVANFPGFGYTPGDDGLACSGDEMVQFADEIFKRIEPKGKLIFLGHSRGSEVALRMSALYENQTTAMVLVNPIGLSAHHGVRPRFVSSFLAWLWIVGSSIRFLLRPMLYFCMFLIITLSIKNGDVGATTVKSVSMVQFSNQLQYIQQLNNSHLQMLIVYSGRDRIIEQSISDDLVQKFDSMERMISEAKTAEPSMCEQYSQKLSAGSRKIAVCFSKEGHQLQRNQAQFLSDAIMDMFENAARQS
ncbi:unnamed protein product [Anisakis simplex]|uniref:AB hydrolase-1 domain-containing protein n=1 Tax=Anisakis simplex TaxID=6269 RepID=A0A0M3JWK9_ANISI|nr:unnamed protein product [Anisakis simplex]